MTSRNGRSDYDVISCIKDCFTIEELEAMDTLSQGQADDLKIDYGTVRVWVSRMTKIDGEEYKVQIERLKDGCWVTIGGYGEPADH